jgi:hypothetical protein
MTFVMLRNARRLLKTPLFTLVAAATLAIGIGANTAIFSVVRGVLLRPLPFHDPERLVGVSLAAPGLGIPIMTLSPAFYLIAREEGQVFEDVGLFGRGAVSVTGTGEPERVQVLFVTDGTLKLLRVNAALGRVFDTEDVTPKTPERILITHAYWQRKFGSDPNVIGRPLVVDGQSREIVGVLPADFRFLDHNPPARAAVPFQPRGASRRRLQLPWHRAAQTWRDHRSGEQGHRASHSAAP